MSLVQSPTEPPSTRSLLKMAYWAILKDPSVARHIVYAVARSAWRLVLLRLQALREPSRPYMALALVEHMGDIVAAEPLARRARRAFPGSRILWFVRRPYKDLPAVYPEVDKVVAVHCLTEWLLLWSYGAVDAAWDLHLSERSCPVCRIPFKKSGNASRITYDSYYDYGNLLEAQSLSAGLVPLPCAPVLRSRPATIEAVDRLALPTCFVVIHTKSNDPSRDWTDQKWRELVETLPDLFNVVEVGSRPHIITRQTSRERSLSGTISILETAEVIRRATLFIGIDSGPAHLANAVGTPGVILLGYYHRYKHHMPYSGGYQDGRKATIVRGSGLTAIIPLELVVEAVKERLAQSSQA